MYTFLVAANIRDVSPETLLSSAARITKRLMPAQGIELVESYTLLPEFRGGWFWLAPTPEQPPTLLSEFVSDRYAALVFGHVRGGAGRTCAETICETWRSQGVSRVRQLDGCFSAVLFDRVDRSIVLLSDLTGRRYLRYSVEQQCLLVSPHDLPIVATGKIPLVFDLETACSIVVWGWSLLAKSLLKPLQTCRPTSYVHWSSGDAHRVEDPLLDLTDRIETHDHTARAAHLDHMIELMRADARQFVAGMAGTEKVRTELTAGLDTRAVLALLLSVAEPSRIQAITRGEEHSLEVHIARRLATYCGVQFSAQVPAWPHPEDFLAHCDVRAFHANGDTSAKDAMNPMRRHNPPPWAGGGGGEIFRGFYYSYKKRTPWTLRFHIPSQLAFKLWKWQSPKRVSALPWQFPERAANVVATRFNQAIEACSKSSTNGYDVLDLFYLYERYGVWGSMRMRMPWTRWHWTPFDSPTLIQLAFRLPPPIAKYCTIHQTLIQRYLPRGYRMRVMGQRLLPSLQSGHPSAKTCDQVYSEAFAGPLSSIVRGLLLCEGSFGSELFGKRNLGLLLDQHGSGARDHLETIGSLITMERWRTMIREAGRMAATTTVKGADTQS